MNRRLLSVLVGTALLIAAVPAAGAAERLSIPSARERAAAYAESTCRHDESCAGAGVQNCRRLADRVVLCRVFDHRRTEAQGNFVCTRLVRLAMTPPSRRVRVTGVGDWSC